MKLRSISRTVALAALMALPVVSTAPAFAESKMSGEKMMGGKMMGGKMSGGMMMGMKMSSSEMMMMKKMMAKMTPAERRTHRAMSMNEKKLMMKMMKMGKM